MSNTLLIFGGSGFIGRNLCQNALKQGYHVYSISTHGKPSLNEDWVHHVNMTWIACDIVTHDAWQQELPKDNCYCINLIGILTQSSQQTYENSIVAPNQIISSWADTYQIPYLFLSAKFGPIGYIKAKKEAEKFLKTHHSRATIIYSGLVTQQGNYLKTFPGNLIKLGMHIPLASYWCRKIYPIDVDTLTNAILYTIDSLDDSKKIVDLTQ